MIGKTLSHYRIVGSLGRGGMGEVFEAVDARLGRRVAIKLLPAEVAQSKRRLSRFEREARLLASLNHPNLATVHEFSLTKAQGGFDTPFLVMELVEGPTLAEQIASGPVPLGDVLRIFSQVAEGLSAAHKKGVIHRDLKPANIKITPDQRVKVLDFGLAKALRSVADESTRSTTVDGDLPVSGSTSNTSLEDAESRTWILAESLTRGHDAQRKGILGTPSYMSPEQAVGGPVDGRTDIWAFGCCLFETLSGARVFSGKTTPDILDRVLHHEPNWDLLETVPLATRELLRRCLSREAEARPRSFAEVLMQLRKTYLRESADEMEVTAGRGGELGARLFDLSPDLLCVAGFDGLLKQVNPAFGRTLGWDREYLLGRPFFDFIHPDDVKATEVELANLAAGMDTLYFENRYRCSDGHYLRLQWTAHPDSETGLIYAVARLADSQGRDDTGLPDTESEPR